MGHFLLLKNQKPIKKFIQSHGTKKAGIYHIFVFQSAERRRQLRKLNENIPKKSLWSIANDHATKNGNQNK